MKKISQALFNQFVKDIKENPSELTNSEDYIYENIYYVIDQNKDFKGAIAKIRIEDTFKISFDLIARTFEIEYTNSKQEKIKESNFTIDLEIWNTLYIIYKAYYENNM